MPFFPPTKRQAHIIWLALTGLAVATIVSLVVGLVWGLGRVIQELSSVLWPLAIAGVLACLLDPVVDFLEQRKVRRTRAVIIVFLAALLVVTSIASAVIPRLVSETAELESRIPVITQKLAASVKGWLANPPKPIVGLIEQLLHRRSKATPSPAPVASAVSTNSVPVSEPAGAVSGASLLSLVDDQTWKDAAVWLGEVLKQVGKWLKEQLTKITSLFSVIAGLALIPVYAFYFLVEKRGITSQWQDYLPVKDSWFKDETVFVITAIKEYMIAFFRGQVLVAICNGILYAIGFSIIGLPYSVLIGLMATCLTIIPFLGAIVTCVTALLTALVAFGDWQHPVLVLVVFAIVQSIEGTVVQPKIMGDRVGLHPVTIIIALMVGTSLLGGILGGILAIPLTAALRVIMFRYVWKSQPIPAEAK